MKIVINRCYGGFGLSREAVLLARKLTQDPAWGGPCLKGDKYDDGTECDYDGGSIDCKRNDPILIKVVETLGCEAASDSMAELKIVEIPDGIDWIVTEYDGMEWVEEKHRAWC